MVYLPTRKPYKNQAFMDRWIYHKYHKMDCMGLIPVSFGGRKLGWLTWWHWWHVHALNMPKKMFQWELCTVICLFCQNCLCIYTCFFFKFVCLVYLCFFLCLVCFLFIFGDLSQKSNLQQNRISSNCSKTHLYAGFGNGQAIGFH